MNVSMKNELASGTRWQARADTCNGCVITWIIITEPKCPWLPNINPRNSGYSRKYRNTLALLMADCIVHSLTLLSFHHNCVLELTSLNTLFVSFNLLIVTHETTVSCSYRTLTMKSLRLSLVAPAWPAGPLDSRPLRRSRTLPIINVIYLIDWAKQLTTWMGWNLFLLGWIEQESRVAEK